jgi:hypothetical protein
MKKMFWLWIVGLSLFLTMVTLAQAPPNPLSVAGFEPNLDYVPNQVLVLVNPSELKPTSSTPNIKQIHFVSKLAQMLRDQGFEVLKPYDIKKLALKAEPLNDINIKVCGGTLLTITSPTRNVDEMLDFVNLAIQEFTARAGYDPARDFYMIVPNDGFTRPDAEMPSLATESSTNFNGLSSSAEGVKIAVIDTGFVLPPSERSLFVTGFKTIQDSRELRAVAPYDTAPPIRSGWNVDNAKIVDNTPRMVTNPPNPPYRPNVYGHGTPVLGIISSIATGATIIPIKACNNLGYCTGKSVTLGLCFALYMRAKVINTSFGGFYNSPLVRGAVRDVITNGGLVVAGAGNSRNLAWHRTAQQIVDQELRSADDPVRGWNRPVYPAAWSEDSLLATQSSGRSHSDGLLSVGSIPPDQSVISSNPQDPFEKISDFSTLNNNVDVVTYGENIETDYSLDSSFTNFARPRVLRSGTSFAAPVISGIAAGIKRTHPLYSPGEIENIIVSSGDTKSYECLLVIRTPPQPAINECRTPLTGTGLPSYTVSKLDHDHLQLLLSVR